MNKRYRCALLIVGIFVALVGCNRPPPIRQGRAVTGADLHQAAGAFLISGVGAATAEPFIEKGKTGPSTIQGYLDSPTLLYWPLDPSGKPWPIRDATADDPQDLLGNTNEVMLLIAPAFDYNGSKFDERRVLGGETAVMGKSQSQGGRTWGRGWSTAMGGGPPIHFESASEEQQRALIVAEPIQRMWKVLLESSGAGAAKQPPPVIALVKDNWIGPMESVKEIRVYVRKMRPDDQARYGDEPLVSVVMSEEIFPFKPEPLPTEAPVWVLKLDDPSIVWIEKKDIVVQVTEFGS